MALHVRNRLMFFSVFFPPTPLTSASMASVSSTGVLEYLHILKRYAWKSASHDITYTTPQVPIALLVFWLVSVTPIRQLNIIGKMYLFSVSSPRRFVVFDMQIDTNFVSNFEMDILTYQPLVLCTLLTLLQVVSIRFPLSSATLWSEAANLIPEAPPSIYTAFEKTWEQLRPCRSSLPRLPLLNWCMGYSICRTAVVNFTCGNTFLNRPLNASRRATSLHVLDVRTRWVVPLRPCPGVESSIHRLSRDHSEYYSWVESRDYLWRSFRPQATSIASGTMSTRSKPSITPASLDLSSV